jgi:hypothetical protein
MNFLKLPEIEPARPVKSAADAFDKFGDDLEGATKAVSGLMYEVELAETAADTQEATLKVTKNLNDTAEIIKSKPYLTPDEVKGMFGGTIPGSISPTEDVVEFGRVVKKPRTVIPMHEVAPHLFEQQSAAALENAASKIKPSGWRRQFKNAAKADIEKARNEASEWATAQRLADAEIRSLSQYEQFVKSRNWGEAKAMLDSPGFSNPTRLKLAAEHDHRRTLATVSGRLRSDDPAELDALIADIDRNEAGDPENLEFAVPLTPDEQLQFRTTASVRKREIRAEREHEEAREREAAYQEVGELVEQAVVQAAATGQPMSKFFGVKDLERFTGRLETKDTQNLIAFIESRGKKDRVTDPAIFTALVAARDTGELARMEPSELFGYVGSLDEEDYQQVLGWWIADRRGEAGAGKKRNFSESQARDINGFVEHVLKVKPDTEEFFRARGTLERGMLEWQKTHADEEMDFNVIAGEGARLFRDTEDKDNSSAKRILIPSLSTLNGGQTPTEQQIEEHLERMEEQAPLVEEAFRGVDPDQLELTPDIAARVYLLTQNPAEVAKLEKRAGRKLDPRGLVLYAVDAIAPDTDAQRAFRAKHEAKLLRTATEREASAAGREMRTEDARDAASMRADEARVRDELTVEPNWEDELAAETNLVRRAITERVYAGDPEYQKKKGKGRDLIGADSRIKREIEAATQAAMAGRREEVRARWQDAQAAYARYREKLKAGDPETVKTNRKLDLYSFERWMKARREGKVR